MALPSNLFGIRSTMTFGDGSDDRPVPIVGDLHGQQHVVLRTPNGDSAMDETNDALRVNPLLLAGEDETNNVFRVESQFEYETVAAGTTGQALGATGAAGDLLSHIILVVSTAATAATSILDGATSISIFPNSPGGGVGTYTIPLNLVSVNGAWSVTTGAGVAAIAVGRFS